MTARTKPKPKAAKKPARKPAKGRGKKAINALTTWQTAFDKDDEWFFHPNASSGERVNEATALGLATYFACIRNISEDEAKLPLGLFQEIASGGRKPLRNHPISYLLQGESNPEMSSFSFRQTLMIHALGWGNGYAEIERDELGRPIALWPLDPTVCHVERDMWGEKLLFYRVHGVPMSPRNILHLHREGFTGLAGWSLCELLKDPLGNALAAQRFSGQFFGNGTTTSGTIEVPDAMSETAFKHLRESFFERFSARNQWKPIILEQGSKWNQTSTDPQKSQMVETFQFGIEEVCRLFRMPPHKVQHLLRATFSNIEEQSLEYVNDCLMGWLERLEQEIAIKLLFPKERQTIYCKHNVNMLLRGDVAKRGTFYQVMFNVGAFSVNDIREKEDMNPVEGGDAHFVNAALVPLEMAATGEHLKQNQPQPAAEQAKKPADGPPPANGKPSNLSAHEHRSEMLGRMAAAHTVYIEREIAAMLRLEHDRLKAAKRDGKVERWTADFYGEKGQNEVARRLKPVIGSLSASLEAILEGAGHG